MRNREVISRIKKLMKEVDPEGLGFPPGVSPEITIGRLCCFIYNSSVTSDIVTIKFKKREGKE
jgi:hypothetical protein